MTPEKWLSEKKTWMIRHTLRHIAEEYPMVDLFALPPHYAYNIMCYFLKTSCWFPFGANYQGMTIGDFNRIEFENGYKWGDL